jgi:hypothetical protein
MSPVSLRDRELLKGLRSGKRMVKVPVRVSKPLIIHLPRYDLASFRRSLLFISNFSDRLRIAGVVKAGGMA